MPRLESVGLVMSVVVVPKLKPVEAVALAAVVVVADPGVPKRPDIPVDEPRMDGLTGAGVEAGIVVSGVADSGGLGPSSIVSISVSLDMGDWATSTWDALSSALPKVRPKKELFDPSDDSGSLSLAERSALNVD